MALSAEQTRELMALPRRTAEDQLMSELSAVRELLDVWLAARDPATCLETATVVDLLDHAKAFRADLETCGERIKEEVRRWHRTLPADFADQDIHHMGYDHIDGS